MIQTFFNGIITLMMTKFMLNDVPHAAGLMNSKRVFTEAARSARIKTTVTTFGGSKYFTTIAVSKHEVVFSMAEYEETVDKVLLRVLSTNPNYVMMGYATRVFVSGPLALSIQTHKSIMTVGLTDDGRAFYKALERKGMITIDADPERSGVFTIRQVR